MRTFNGLYNLVVEFVGGATRGKVGNMHIKGDSLYSRAFGKDLELAVRLQAKRAFLVREHVPDAVAHHRTVVLCCFDRLGVWYACLDQFSLESVAERHFVKIKDLHEKIARSRSRAGRYIIELRHAKSMWEIARSRLLLQNDKLDDLLNGRNEYRDLHTKVVMRELQYDLDKHTIR